MTNRNLIFDVGANDGTDTAYYLGLGHSVVAVEADPNLAARLCDRFAVEIAEGRVMVVNVAVTEEDREEVVLYVSKENTESSLIREMAERSGDLREQVTVSGRSLCSLFHEYGLPWYCKIDIEGYDAIVVRGMTPCAERPAYISCEAAGHPISEVADHPQMLLDGLEALAAQGYRQFKLVDQESLVVLGDDGLYDRLNSWSGRIRAKLDRLGALMTFGRLPERAAVGETGSASGSFGEQLAGEWVDYHVTRRRMEMHFAHYYHYTKNKLFIFWVDIHAKY